MALVSGLKMTTWVGNLRLSCDEHLKIKNVCQVYFIQSLIFTLLHPVCLTFTVLNPPPGISYAIAWNDPRKDR